MTTPQCATGCGRPSPSAAWCTDCTTAALRSLQVAATIEPDLRDAIGKQLRRGTTGKTTSSEIPLPIDVRAMEAASALRLALGLAVKEVTQLPLPAGTITGLARWLLKHLPSLAVADHDGIHHQTITTTVSRAVRVLDAPPERHPAGDCDLCGRPLLAEPGADKADCECGATQTGIIASRAQRAAEADVLGTATEVAGALSKIGICVSAGTIRMWASRQRLSQRPGGVYAMSDVLALIGQRDARMRG